MINFHKIHKSISLFLLLAFWVYAMATQFAVPNLVLCIGEEGHVAIEPIAYSLSAPNLGDFPLSSVYARQHQQVGVQDKDCQDIELHERGTHFSLQKKEFSFERSAEVAFLPVSIFHKQDMQTSFVFSFSEPAFTEAEKTLFNTILLI